VKASKARAGGLRLVLLAAAIAATGWLHAGLGAASVSEDDALRVPTPAHARLAALGFDPVVADYYWVQALQVVGGTTGSVEQYSKLIGDLIEVVTALDPWVDHPYRFAAMWLTSSYEDVRRGNALLDRAVAYHPLDWRNRFYLGYNHFFYLEDNARAAEVLEPAISLEGAPNYLGAFVARLQADGGDLDTAAYFLRELIRNAPDEYVRAEYLKAFDEIETERRARLLDRARVAYWKQNRRDIQRVEDLWQGEGRVIQAPPPPHPHFKGFHWMLDEESNEIVSSFYKTRYELHVHPLDAERQALWQKRGDATDTGDR